MWSRGAPVSCQLHSGSGKGYIVLHQVTDGRHRLHHIIDGAKELLPLLCRCGHRLEALHCTPGLRSCAVQARAQGTPW